MLKQFGSKESVQYDPPPSKHIFDYNYQKVGILNVIEMLKDNNSTSAKLKSELLKKAQDTLGLRVLPSADRVLPFFHLHDGKFFRERKIRCIQIINRIRCSDLTGEISVTFVYNDPPFTPWQVLIANNFGDLVPLYKQVYDLIRTPVIASNGHVIGSVNVFHNKTSSIPALTNGSLPQLAQLEHPNDRNVVVVFEEPESHDMQVALPTGNNKLNRMSNQNKHSLLNGEKGHGRGRPPNPNKRTARMISKKVTVSASMPGLDEFDHSDSSQHHRYSTRRKLNNTSFVNNQSII